MTTRPNLLAAGVTQAIIMAASFRFGKAYLLVGTAFGLAVLSGALFALALLSLVLSGWDDQAPAWQIRSDQRFALWALFLNGANIALLLALTLPILNPMRIFYWPEPALRRVNVLLIALANVSIMTITGMLIYVALPSHSPNAFSVWLWHLPLTGIALSASAALAAISAQQLRIPAHHAANLMLHLITITHIVVALFSVVIILSIAELAAAAASNPSYDNNGTVPIIWASLVAALFITLCLHCSKIPLLLTLAGTATSAFAFSSACFYAPLFHPGTQHTGTWYPVPLTAIPLLLFLTILLRRYRLRTRNRP